MVQTLKVKSAFENEKCSMVLKQVGAVVVQQNPLVANDADISLWSFISQCLMIFYQVQYTIAYQELRGCLTDMFLYLNS